MSMSRSKLNTLCSVLPLIAACATNPKPQVETLIPSEVISRCEKAAATIREKIRTVNNMTERLKSKGFPVCGEVSSDPNLGRETLFEWLHPHGDDATICVNEHEIPIITDVDFEAHNAMRELSRAFEKHCTDLDQK